MLIVKQKTLYSIAICSLLLLSSCNTTWFGMDKLPWYDEGDVLFNDDFKDHSSGWEIGSNVYELKGYSDNGYLISVNTINSRSWSNPGLNLADIKISVETQKIKGPDDTNFGVICRYQDQSNYYAFLISSDGYYGIMLVEDGFYAMLDSGRYEYSEIINKQDGKNAITVECLGKSLSLTVNGEKLMDVTDPTFSAGDIGLMLETRSAGSAAALFNNLEVIKLLP